MSKLLVTGAAGFIGSHLVDKLMNKGASIIGLDNLFTGNLKNLEAHLKKDGFHFVNGDIRDFNVLRRSVAGMDCVFHLAAIVSVPFSVKEPFLTHEVNVTGTLNLLRACLDGGVKRFVSFSSSSVYGEPRYLPLDEEHPTSPVSPLAASKLAAEHYCKVFHKTYGLETVVLRLFNVYGPRQSVNDEGAVTANFTERLRRRLPLIIYGDGNQTRDFVHVDDVVEATLLAMENANAVGEVFNIGSGISTSVNELAKTIQDLAGYNLQTVYEEPRLGDIKRSFANIDKARKTLGHNPRITLRQGLKTLLSKSVRKPYRLKGQ